MCNCCEATQNPPLERGAALAVGCVTMLPFLVFITFNYFPEMFLLIFARNTPRHYRATPLKRGFFGCVATNHSISSNPYLIPFIILFPQQWLLFQKPDLLLQFQIVTILNFAKPANLFL